MPAHAESATPDPKPIKDLPVPETLPDDADVGGGGGKLWPGFPDISKRPGQGPIPRP